jgi:hypothetical protein
MPRVTISPNPVPGRLRRIKGLEYVCDGLAVYPHARILHPHLDVPSLAFPKGPLETRADEVQRRMSRRERISRYPYPESTRMMIRER